MKARRGTVIDEASKSAEQQAAPTEGAAVPANTAPLHESSGVATLGEIDTLFGEAQLSLHPQDLRFTVRRLGLAPYIETWQAMKAFTDSRTSLTPDEIWLLEHPPVYTYGVAGRPEHLPPGETTIPVIKTDRGGQVTYHGPGQLIVYVLMDLKRRRLTIRSLVRALEQGVIDLLDDCKLIGERHPHAPGVYVQGAKVAALGLRIKRGCSYHGLSLNVDMVLEPFRAIDPCGYPGLPITQLRNLGIGEPMDTLSERLVSKLIRQLEFPA